MFYFFSWVVGIQESILLFFIPYIDNIYFKILLIGLKILSLKTVLLFKSISQLDLETAAKFFMTNFSKDSSVLSDTIILCKFIEL